MVSTRLSTVCEGGFVEHGDQAQHKSATVVCAATQIVPTNHHVVFRKDPPYIRPICKAKPEVSAEITIRAGTLG